MLRWLDVVVDEAVLCQKLFFSVGEGYWIVISATYGIAPRNMYRKIDAVIVNHCAGISCGIRGGHKQPYIPLSLYSLGSSFLAFMLNDDDARELA